MLPIKNLFGFRKNKGLDKSIIQKNPYRNNIDLNKRQFIKKGLFGLAGLSGLALASKVAKAGGLVFNDGSTQTVSGGLTLGTSQATTSGTAITFTGIPSGTKRITVNVTGVSTDGSNGIVVRIGPSGGIVTTGYLSAALNDIGHNNSGGGFMLNNGTDAASLWHGTWILTLVDSANNSWVSSSSAGATGTIDGAVAGGSISLAGELTQVQLTSEGTPDDFDAGKVNITYE